MNTAWIFLDRTVRLRSGWRVLVFVFLFLFGLSITAVIGSVALKLLPFETGPESPLVLAISSIMMLVPALIAGWLCGRQFEQLPFRALGASFTNGWLRHLLLGFAFGAATICLAVLIAVASGGLSFEVSRFDPGALFYSTAVSFFVFALGAATEEVLFRGYVFQTLTRSGFAALAIGLTSVLFGLVHSRNPDAGVIAILNTVLAGVWFGIAYLKTRDLWFVWSMHLVWNWLQAAFFGIEVSGLTYLAPAPFFREIDSGPHWLTGTTYGLEGGIVTSIALIASTVAIYFVPWLKADEELLKLRRS